MFIKKYTLRHEKSESELFAFNIETELVKFNCSCMMYANVLCVYQVSTGNQVLQCVQLDDVCV